MSHGKNRVVPEKREVTEPVELENQFILRLPEEPARVLREALRLGGPNLKERFTIQVENDMRYGEVRIDHWLLHAKIVDLPTIVESLKTIDNKSFYKTADICQMMICKEEPEIPSTDDESPSKNKKKDPNKVDKKFLWPHGITPPTKNVRRRRFRKTLKKKYVEAPEIEKEVKRLLREDNDAVSIKWEIISEDDDQMKQEISGETEAGAKDGAKNSKKVTKTHVTSNKSTPSSNLSSAGGSGDFGSPDEATPRIELVEHDIFGGAVSDSDEEEDTNIKIDLDDNSLLSADDSTLNDSGSLQGLENDDKLVTQFSSDMFVSPSNSSINNKPDEGQNQNDDSGKIDTTQNPGSSNVYRNNSYVTQNAKESLMSHIEDLHEQLQELQSQRLKKQREVESMENAALRKRFEEMLQTLVEKIRVKELEWRVTRDLLRSQMKDDDSEDEEIVVD